MKLRERLARTSTKLAFTTFRAMFQAAVDDGVLTTNPAQGLARTLGLGKKKGGKDDVKAFTREQVNFLLATARREEAHYFPIFLTLYQTGLRIGECVGLEWDDLTLDPKGREIHVQRSIDDKTGAVGTPKNGEDRHVDMSLELLDCLKKHKVRAAERTLRRGWGEVAPWVFCTVNKTPIAAHDVRQAFKRTLKAAGLPSYFTVHCLRHIFATLHLEANQGRLLYVSRQLGHSSIAITADVYAGRRLPLRSGIKSDENGISLWTPFERTEHRSGAREPRNPSLQRYGARATTAPVAPHLLRRHSHGFSSHLPARSGTVRH